MNDQAITLAWAAHCATLAGMKPTSHARFPVVPHAQGEEVALLRRIIGDPTDPLPRAVLADWLEDQGRDEEAAWWREQWGKEWPGWSFTPTDMVTKVVDHSTPNGREARPVTFIRAGRLEGRFPAELIAHFDRGSVLLGLAARDESRARGLDFDVPKAIVDWTRPVWPDESPLFDHNDPDEPDGPHLLLVTANTSGPFRIVRKAAAGTPHSS